MSTVGVRVTPKPGLNPEAVRDRLAAANWDLLDHADGGPILALGEFSALEDGTKAFAVAGEVGDPVSFLDTDEVQDLREKAKVGLAPTEAAGAAVTDMTKTVFGTPATSDGKAPAAAPTPVKYAGPPNIPVALLERLSVEEGSKVVSKYIEGWLRFATNREEQAAWNPSREASLLAHIRGDEARSAAAAGLLSEESRASGQRANLLAEVVGMAAAMKGQVAAWTALAGKVPRLLAFSVALGAVFVGWSLLLVHEGKLSGLELALLAFVFALAAISPATLLLLGRPLKGMDEWTPDKLFGADKDDKKDDKKSDAGKTDEAAKPSGEKPTVDSGKAGDTSGKTAAS